MAAQQESLDLEGMGVKVQARGKDVKAPMLLFILAGGIGYFGWLHHDASMRELQMIREQMAENTYVLSLSQADRERLNLQMPDSLRRRVQRQ